MIFQQIFLIQDISHKNANKHLGFGKLIDKMLKEETVSQILYLWLSFCFMKSRNIKCKK